MSLTVVKQSMLGCFLFDGVLGRHIELAGHLVAVVFFQVIVERQVVAGNGATYRGGVGCEEGGNLGYMLADVKGTCSPSIHSLK